MKWVVLNVLVVFLVWRKILEVFFRNINGLLIKKIKNIVKEILVLFFFFKRLCVFLRLELCYIFLVIEKK